MSMALCLASSLLRAGHTSTHTPHPVQSSGATWMVSASPGCSREEKSLDWNPCGAPSSAEGSNTFIWMAVCGHTRAHLPQSMHIDGSHTGISSARVRFSHLALEIPVWDPSICIDCGKCALVCPHTAIRMKVFEPSALETRPEGFKTKPFTSREHPGLVLSIQVAPDDCTGCGVCVDVCPARSKQEVKHKAIDMEPIGPHLEAERSNFEFFLDIPDAGRSILEPDTIKGSQVRDPLFESSGACAGCGETPYLKLLSQMFGDRILVANATGCSSIYGGNLPTTPWSANLEGRGPAWANSLFEDNAEFGLGLRLALARIGSRAG